MLVGGAWSKAGHAPLPRLRPPPPPGRVPHRTRTYVIGHACPASHRELDRVSHWTGTSAAAGSGARWTCTAEVAVGSLRWTPPAVLPAQRGSSRRAWPA